MAVPVSHCPPLGCQELSARGVHPPARGWGSVGVGTTIHTWSCCVSGPQSDPTLWGRRGPGMSQPFHTAARSSGVWRGSGWWPAGAAGLERMEGLGGGAGSCCCVLGGLCSAFLPPGHHRLCVIPQPLACSGVSAQNQHIFPAQLFLPQLLCHGAGSQPQVRAGGPMGGTSCSSPDPHGCDRGALCATAHLHPGHTAGTVSKDILTS